MKKELHIRQSVNFTVEIQARKGWDDISKVLKGEKKKLAIKNTLFKKVIIQK